MSPSADTIGFLSEAHLQVDAEIFEYSTAANPIKSGAVPAIPIAEFLPDLYASGPSRIVPLDLSRELKLQCPATTPSLLANFIRISADDSVETKQNSSSDFYYVIRGRGKTKTAYGIFTWSEGDIFTLPGCAATHSVEAESALYTVSDEPLFTYLGARPGKAKFVPTRYSKAEISAELAKSLRDPESASRSRISVLIANSRFRQTMTITHTLWAMFGIVPPGARQLPHRHQSVALDFVVSAERGAYTLVGAELTSVGLIKNPLRVDWKPGAVFVTPPGLWHEHHNESKREAYIMPIQDAGLHTYLRTLDIQFYRED